MNSKTEINLLVNEEIDREEWIVFLDCAKASNPFQTPSFYEFLQADPGQDSLAIAFKDQDGIKAVVVAAILKEFGLKAKFSERAIVYGGPSYDSPECIPILLEALEQKLKGKAIYIEIRNFFDFKPIEEQFADWEYKAHMNVKLQLNEVTDRDTYLATLKYNRRREIKQSLKAGAVYAETTRLSDIEAIYKILDELYKERVKLPLPSLGFFLNQLLFDCFKVFVVKHNDQVIGGAFTLLLEGKGIYTWYYCGIRKYDKKIFPTHLAVMAVIDFAISKGLSHVDFMGAGKPEEEYGVRQYKMQFGGELVEEGRFLKILSPLMFSVGKTGLKVLSKIKK